MFDPPENLEVTFGIVSYTSSLPWSIMATSSHISETSLRRCELMKINLFLLLSDLTISLTSLMPLGSSPLVGSSKRRMHGSLSNVDAMQILCFIPLENFPTLLSIHSVIWTSVTASSTRFLISFDETPLYSAIIVRASRGVSEG